MRFKSNYCKKAISIQRLKYHFFLSKSAKKNILKGLRQRRLRLHLKIKKKYWLIFGAIVFYPGKIKNENRMPTYIYIFQKSKVT